MRIKNNEINMVVSDFDGTLLRDDMSVPSEKFYKVLHNMLEHQIGFIAASGRQYPSLRKMMSDVEDKIGFIAENGSLVIWKGKIVHKCFIRREYALSIIEELKKEQNLDIYVSGVNNGYITSRDKTFVKGLENAGMDIEIIDDFAEVKEDIMKISGVYRTEIPEDAKERFRQKFGNKVCILDSGKGWLDFIPKESGKGSALQKLSEIAGFSLDKTVAFGDQENDISMFQTVKLGYAMDTAYDYVKKAADDTCKIVEDTLWNAICEQTV